MNIWKYAVAALGSTKAKALLSSLIVAGWVFLRDAVVLWVELMHINPAFVVGLTGLWLLDFVTGLIRAVRQGGRISSTRMMDTIWKGVSYLFVGMAFVMLANTFASTFAHEVLLMLCNAVILVMAMSEAWSVMENMLGGAEGAKAFMQRVGDVIKHGALAALPTDDSEE